MRMRYLILCVMLVLIALPVSAQTTPTEATPTAREWDGQSRYTVLVMGLDRRPDERSLFVRTDALLVMSIQPATQTLGVLTISRDMHFAMFDADDLLVRVNSLVVRGENREAGTGFDYAVETIQYNLGMYIDAYIAFDFTAFEFFIDALGGLPIDVPYTINDPFYPDANYGYDPFYLRPGSYVMDGATALRYARTRQGDSEYLRGERQIDIVQAIMARLRDEGLLQQLIVNAPRLFNQLDGHIYTNMSPSQAITLGLSALQLRDAEFKRGALNQDYSFSYAYQGGRVRVPDRALLGELLQATFGDDYWR